MTHSIKVSNVACQGCVNCIKSCPTEAIRVINGNIRIIESLCINCSECLRVCTKNALGMQEDDWELIRALGSGVAIADPSFFAQFGPYWVPANIETEMTASHTHLLFRETEDAFDLCAYAAAKSIEGMTREQLPLISTYCPSVLRLIQLQFPELIGRLLTIENPLEIAASLWRTQSGSQKPITLFSPCPARVSMINSPIGRTKSEIQYAVSIRKVVRLMQASGCKVSGKEPEHNSNFRSGLWANRGGEARHIKAFSEKPLITISVSGIRNTRDLLQELELGRLNGVDFVECRMCDTGCIGGVGTAESRFIAGLNTMANPNWEIPAEKRKELDHFYRNQPELWKLSQPIPPKQRLPLSEDLPQAMALLKKMNDLYTQLPHIDCGACGRPSCQAMAEDIVRGNGEISDCAFKLRESITSLANRIISLASTQPNTIKGRTPL